MKIRGNIMRSNKSGIIIIVLISCVIMGIIDAIIQPGYAIKSAVKIGLFLILPILYSCFIEDCSLKQVITPNFNSIKIAIALGLGIYVFILGAYFLFRGIFDFSSVTSSLESGVGVTKTNFIWVAIYISLVNSLLEEFFFRGFAFLSLKRIASRRFAYIFSSAVFAFYHIAMMIGWFHISVILLSLIGLFIGGLIFNFFNEKSGNIYTSWLVHMCANFSINTIGFILFGIL